MSAAAATTTTISTEEQYDPQKVEELKRRIANIERTTWDTSKTQKYRDLLAKEYAKPGNPNPDAVVDPPSRYKNNAPRVKGGKEDEETNFEKKKPFVRWTAILTALGVRR